MWCLTQYFKNQNVKKKNDHRSQVIFLLLLRRPVSIFSCQVEAWLKQNEVKFITKHRALETNEGSNVEWRASARHQLGYSQYSESPLLSFDMFSSNVPPENYCVCFSVCETGTSHRFTRADPKVCSCLVDSKLLIAYSSILQTWSTSLWLCLIGFVLER